MARKSRRPVALAVDALEAVAEGRSRLATFVRGLTVGALVGAAMAGLVAAERRREVRRRGTGESDGRVDAGPGS